MGNQIKLIGLEQLQWFYEEKVENIVYFIFDIVNNQGSNIQSKTVSLTSSAWSSETQTVTISGITTSSKILVNPNDYGIYCYTISTNSITFKYKTKPTSDISLNILVLN